VLAVHRAPSSDSSDEPTGFAACALGNDSRTACEARRFTRTTLGDWWMSGPADNVTLVVAEMLGNAMRHGLTHTAAGRPLTERPGWLGLLRQGGGVLCAVSGPGTDVPVVREPHCLAESGRGLHLIDSSANPGDGPTPNPWGSRVWAVAAAPWSSEAAPNTIWGLIALAECASSDAQ
jgi:hypothetical protein